MQVCIWLPRSHTWRSLCLPSPRKALKEEIRSDVRVEHLSGVPLSGSSRVKTFGFPIRKDLSQGPERWGTRPSHRLLSFRKEEQLQGWSLAL